MQNRKLEVGDVVRYVGDYNEWLTQGKEYTVVDAGLNKGFSCEFYVGEISNDKGFPEDIVSADLGQLYEDFEFVRGENK